MEMRSASVDNLKGGTLLLATILHCFSYINEVAIEVPQVYLDEINKGNNFFYITYYGVLFVITLMLNRTQGSVLLKSSICVTHTVALYFIGMKLFNGNFTDWTDNEKVWFFMTLLIDILSLLYIGKIKSLILKTRLRYVG